MGESSAPVLNYSDSALNSLKKSELVLKGKLIVDADLHKLSGQISKLKEAIDQISLENRKFRSELVITQNVSNRLEEKIINLEEKSGERGGV